MEDWLRTFGEATDDLTNHPTGFMITTNQKSLVVSILSAGTFVGALTGAFTGDFLGRKWGIIFTCLVFSVGVAMQTASTALPLFIVGRVIAGIGVGQVSVLIPMYQSEWCVTLFASFHSIPAPAPISTLLTLHTLLVPSDCSVQCHSVLRDLDI